MKAAEIAVMIPAEPEPVKIATNKNPHKPAAPTMLGLQTWFWFMNESERAMTNPIAIK
jgi:hypothetical protein